MVAVPPLAVNGRALPAKEVLTGFDTPIEAEPDGNPTVTVATVPLPIVSEV
jgi:hypothetical protein